MIAHYLRGRPVTPFLDLLLEGHARRSLGSLVLPPSTSISSSSYSFSISCRLRVVPLRRFNTATVRAECSTWSSIKLETFRLDRNVNRGGILLQANGRIVRTTLLLSFSLRGTYHTYYFKLRILIIKVLGLRVAIHIGYKHGMSGVPTCIFVSHKTHQ